MYKLTDKRGQSKDIFTREHPENEQKINYDIIKYKTDAGFTLNQQQHIFEENDITLNFRKKTYDELQILMLFIDTLDIMILSKNLPTGEIYKKRLIFKSQKESRVHLTDLYDYAVTFTALSHWFEQIIIKDIKDPVGNSTYPMKYPIKYKNIKTTTLEFVVVEKIVSPIDIQIFGEAINPSYTLFDGLGNIVGQGAFTLNIDINEVLDINARRGTTQVSNNVGNITNVYALQDFTKSTFLEILKEGTYNFSITHEGVGSVTAIIRYVKTRYIV